MTNEFTANDRKFIIKIASECDALKKRVKTLENEKNTLSSTKAVGPHKKSMQETVAKNVFKIFNADSYVHVEYGHNPPSVDEQKVLATSLYNTLYALCDDNDISILSVTIKPQQ